MSVDDDSRGRVALDVASQNHAVQCSVRHAICKALAHSSDEDCDRDAKKCAWAVLRSADGRTLVVDSQNEFKVLWVEVQTTRGKSVEHDIMKALDKLSNLTDGTDEFVVIPDSYMDAFIKSARIKRAHVTLETERDVRAALRAAKAGDVIQLDNDTVQVFRITNPQTWRIDDVVVQTKFIMLDTFRLHVLSVNSVLPAEYQQVMLIERLNYPDEFYYKFVAAGVHGGLRDPKDPDFVWFLHTAKTGDGDLEPRRVEGYALLDTSHPGFVYVDDVGVRPDAQGRGVGAALVRRFVEWFNSHSERFGRAGQNNLVLKVPADDQVAIELYTRHGFSLSRKKYGVLMNTGYVYMDWHPHEDTPRETS